MRDHHSQPTTVMHAPDATAMEAIGSQFGRVCPAGALIYLQGNLGAGKTTLVRGFLRGLGYLGRVKSPTYTLLEPYATDRLSVYHMDLYRIVAPEELEAIGIRDYLDNEGICLIEWPEKAAPLLPTPDLLVRIEFANPGRELTLIHHTPTGRDLVDTLFKTDR